MKSFFFIGLAVMIFLSPPAWSECPGDIDLDGDVDAKDLSELALNFGSTGCSTSTVNLEDYRAPSGMVKIVNIRRFTKEDPWYSDTTLTVTSGENVATWTYENGSSTKYYDDREEYYDPEDTLYATRTYSPSSIETLPDVTKRIGESWGGHFVSTLEYFQEPQGSTVNVWAITLLGIEDVTVPAGTFQNCIKILINRGNQTTSMIRWYAPGIGWVKRVYESTSTSGGTIYEVTAYQVPE